MSQLRTDSAPFVMSSQPVFQPARNASGVVPSIVKHMPGSLSVAAAPFVSSFASSSPMPVVAAPAAATSSLSLFGSSIWGPDASAWSAPPDTSQRRGPLGSLIASATLESNDSSETFAASSLSSSPTLEFFVPSLLGDDAMDELNDETFASALDGDDDMWAVADSDATIAQDIAMRERFSLVSVVGGDGVFGGAVSLQAATAAPVLSTTGSEAGSQVTATTASGVVEEEKKISRREQKKKRMEERKRQQLQEKQQQSSTPDALTGASTTAVAAALNPSPAGAAQKSMQWKDVVAKAAPNPPPAAPVPTAPPAKVLES